jgi:hypothetical protein
VVNGLTTYTVTAIGDNTNNISAGVTTNFSIVFQEPTNVISINQNAFDNATYLVGITVPPSVYITQYAFNSCNNLPYILSDDSSHVNSCVYFVNATDSNTATLASNILTIKNNVTINSVNYPIRIGAGSIVANLTGITQIVFPTIVTSINANAFKNCTSLQTLTFTATSSISSIGNSAFYNCTSLNNLIFPPSLTYFGPHSFEDCISVTTFRVVTNGNIVINVLFDVDVFKNCTNLPCVFLDDSVQPCVVFINATDSTTSSISGNVLTIKDNAIISGTPYPIKYVGGNTMVMNLNGINSIIFGVNIININQYAFSSTAGLQNVSFSGNNLVLIDQLAFVSSALISITIPSSVTTIGQFTFTGSQLQTITFASGSNLQYIPNGMFNNCSLLENINNIPATVTSILEYAFNQCPSLTYISFDGEIPPTVSSNSVFNSSYSPLVIGYLQNYALTSDWETAFSQYSNSITFSGNTIDSSCFLANTKILCVKDHKEIYIAIQDLKVGDRVKTLASGYQKVSAIGRSTIMNHANTERITNRLYKCSKENYPQLFEDLYLTGCHSILKNTLTAKEKKDTIKFLGQIYVTEKKYRLIACFDNKAVPYENEGIFDIYHLALEHHNDYMNYGIYANGLLVESISKANLKSSQMVLY